MLFISASFPNVKDGIGDSAAFLYKAYLKKCKNCILVTSNDYKIKSYLQDNNLKNIHYINNWKCSIKNILFFTKLLKNEKVIHLEYPGVVYGKSLFPIILLLLARYNNVKIILRLHEFSQASQTRKIVITLLVKISNYVFVPSNIDYEILKEKYGEKIKKTHIGSNIPFISLKKEYSPKKEYIIISYFGFIYPSKGFENLLDIWNQILHKTNKKIRFLIIGELSDCSDNQYAHYHKKILKKIDELGITDLIDITGFVSPCQVSQYMQDSDFTILPFSDGLTLRRGSFISYLEHNIPIITSNGDQECNLYFKNHVGIEMIDSNLMVDKAVEWIEHGIPAVDNDEFSSLFNWDNIVDDFISTIKEER